MFRQPTLSVRLSDPPVAQAIQSPVTRSVLELVRRFPRAATPTELSRAGGLDFVVVRRGLDLLEQAGLVVRHPIDCARREPAFSAVADSVIVSFDPSSADEVGQLETLDRLMVEHAREKLEEARRSRPMGTGGFRFRGYLPMRLDDQQLAEMKEIMHRLHRFFERVSSLQQPPDAAPPQPSEQIESQECNYVALFEVAPAAPGLLPMAPISFAPLKEAPVIEGLVRERRIHQLSAREKQIASALAQGRSRPEIAVELGISINTVASIGKRVYAKLGVSRRAELAARLRG